MNNFETIPMLGKRAQFIRGVFVSPLLLDAEVADLGMYDERKE